MEKFFFDERLESLLSGLNNDTVNKIMPLLASRYIQKEGIQNYHPTYIATVLEGIGCNHPSEILLLCKKVLLVGAILNNWEDIHKSKILDQYKCYLERIYKVTEMSDQLSLNSLDIFWKELAIARLQFFPITSGIVDFYSGFGFRQGLNRNLFQSIDFIYFILKYGRKPYYRTHLHTPTLDCFSAEGWIESYLQIAKMLEADESVKGLIRTSWYFDPSIKKISPHLSYLQELPLNNGAKLFHVGLDKSGCALKTSKVRRELNNQGIYTPINYLLVWPRAAIIRWANIQKMSKP